MTSREIIIPVRAVVSRGGRPDLVPAPLRACVTAATLLIVGGDDTDVLELNRQAAAQLRCPHRAEVVVGASHLFEEAGALGNVAILASRWFVQHLAGDPVAASRLH